MIPYGRQSIDREDINAAENALNSDWLTQGPKILEFEKALARYCGAGYAVACANGTAALHLAYLAGGLKKGDEVITAPNTFAATSNMLLAVGAKPVFCDIRLDSYNIDEDKIEKLITRKTKAIVPVHFAGQSCRMDEIKQIARKRKLLVIDDACHALGGKFKNRKIGSCFFSDMTVFSFHAIKPITTGEGGAVMTNSKKIYERLLLLRSHGIHKDKKGKNVMTELGYNYRITDIQAAIGFSQLKKLDQFIDRRRQVATWYGEKLKEVKDIILPVECLDNFSGWHIYVIRVKNKKRRDGLLVHLKKNEIGANFHYPAVYSHPYYRNNGYAKTRLAGEDEYAASCVTLPCHPSLNEKEIGYVSDKIKQYFD